MGTPDGSPELGDGFRAGDGAALGAGDGERRWFEDGLGLVFGDVVLLEPAPGESVEPGDGLWMARNEG